MSLVIDKTFIEDFCCNIDAIPCRILFLFIECFLLYFSSSSAASALSSFLPWQDFRKYDSAPIGGLHLRVYAKDCSNVIAEEEQSN